MIGSRARVVTVLIGAVVALPGCDPSQPYLLDDCTRSGLDGRSVARVWDEALLGAIRRDVPAPTVHARNLFHTSVAMWDAWAAFDPGAEGYLVQEKHHAEDVRTAREAAISYAAFRVLLHRYSLAAGLQETFAELAATMRQLCYRVGYSETESDTPAAVGNRIAAAVIAAGTDDGSLEKQRYVDTAYEPVNDPMIVASDEVTMRDPDRWQPLALARSVAQNGLPIPDAVQSFVGPHWGRVRGFALPASADGMPIDPGDPPQLGENSLEFKRSAVEVIRLSSELDPSDGVVMDIGPGVVGGNPLGTNDGDGHEVNPVTGEPYQPNPVPRADFARVLTEFWADGPASETPPGHWNVVANSVTDSPGFRRRIGGRGPELDPLEWDVKMYLALNGALHDAAIAAWGVKGRYDSVRPISMIRYMGGLGQSSDARRPAFHPDGLPLVPGLVEVVTRRSSSPGARHERLAEHVGSVAVRSWLGNPEDPASQTGGVGWIPASGWMPYQEPTFVTPAFAGYVSGHSAFSRAAAEVMTRLTGSPFFPGGISEWTVPAGELANEAGPSQDVTLQWATYYDAADQAGISRLYGGIHIRADDLEGRKIGSRCGKEAWALATRYFDGAPG